MKFGVVGATGRMGLEIMQQIVDSPNLTLASALVQDSNQYLGHDVGEVLRINKYGVKFSSDIEQLLSESEVIIDFTTVPLSHQLAKLNSTRFHKAHVIGTTGFSDQEQADLLSFAKSTPILYSANMSIGFNLLLCLSKQLAKMTGDEFDIGILEMHHRNKKDAPSGSALRLGQAILGAKNKDFKENILFFPEPTRARGKIEFASLRGGDVIGDHTVVFASDGERIELTHKASNRKIFATGAVKAAKWLYGKPAGLYSMEDVFLS